MELCVQRAAAYLRQGRTPNTKLAFLPWLSCPVFCCVQRQQKPGQESPGSIINGSQPMSSTASAYSKSRTRQSRTSQMLTSRGMTPQPDMSSSVCDNRLARKSCSTTCLPCRHPVSCMVQHPSPSRPACASLQGSTPLVLGRHLEGSFEPGARL